MKRHKSSFIILVLFCFALLIGLGYAYLSSNLSINGMSALAPNTWDVHFSGVQTSPGSVTLPQGDLAPTIDTSTYLDISYRVTLTEPGDFYEFTVNVVNDGSIDAMIDSITSKLNGVDISLSNPIPAYCQYTITYSDDEPLEVHQLLKKSTTEVLKIRIAYSTDANANQLPSADSSLSFQFGLHYVQADDSAVRVLHVNNFAEDDWETIVGAIQSGKDGIYHVGDTKQITLENGLGTHTVRIANKSTPAECATEGFSQTACGFVIEFVDIITRHRMNSTNVSLGGWKESELRPYLNDVNDSNSIINSLPGALRNAVIDTFVVSGHGASDVNNFTTTDKLYLLSSHEVWEDDDGDTNVGFDVNDAAYYQTRQLDYYSGLNVTTSSPGVAKKKRDGSDSYWWLRSANFKHVSNFIFVSNSGHGGFDGASTNFGVSPAFRLG